MCSRDPTVFGGSVNWNSMDVEPRFYEIDSYNIVNNMYYLSWMEMARLKVARDAGLLVPRLYSEGIFFVVTEAHIHYENAVNFWDKVRIETVITKVEGSRMEFQHRVKSQMTKTRMATAQTSIICLKQGNVIPRMPEWMDQKVEHYISETQQGLQE